MSHLVETVKRLSLKNRVDWSEVYLHLFSQPRQPNCCLDLLVMDSIEGRSPHERSEARRFGGV